MAMRKNGYVAKRFDKERDTLEDVARELERLNSLGTYTLPDGQTAEGRYEFNGDGFEIRFYPNSVPKTPKTAETAAAESGIDLVE